VIFHSYVKLPEGKSLFSHSHDLIHGGKIIPSMAYMAIFPAWMMESSCHPQAHSELAEVSREIARRNGYEEVGSPGYKWNM
jgi:hypothetical protein